MFTVCPTLSTFLILTLLIFTKFEEVDTIYYPSGDTKVARERAEPELKHCHHIVTTMTTQQLPNDNSTAYLKQ